MRSKAYRTPFNKTIPEYHGIVNGPTIQLPYYFEPTHPELSARLPSLDHQKTTASCPGHTSSCSVLVERHGLCSHEEERTFLSSQEYVGPLAEGKLSQIAQFRKIDEAGNMSVFCVKLSRSRGIESCGRIFEERTRTCDDHKSLAANPL